VAELKRVQIMKFRLRLPARCLVRFSPDLNIFRGLMGHGYVSSIDPSQAYNRRSEETNMASLQIPKHLEDQLLIEAECSGRTKEELAAEILAAHLGDESVPLSAFTQEQLTRLQESVEQVKRGELIPEEEIDKFFEDWVSGAGAR